MYNFGYDCLGFGFILVVFGVGDVMFEQGLFDVSQDCVDGFMLCQYSVDMLLCLGVGGLFELQLVSLLWNWLIMWGMLCDIVYGCGSSSFGVKFVFFDQVGFFSWGLLGSVIFIDGNFVLCVGYW